MRNISIVYCLTSMSPVTGWNESFSRMCLSQSEGRLFGDLLQWVSLLSGWNICFLAPFTFRGNGQALSCTCEVRFSGSIGWLALALSLCGSAQLWAGFCDGQLGHDTLSLLNS